MAGFDNILDDLDGSDTFEEIPVTPEEFVTSKEYLGLPPLSDYQITLIKAGTQIYRRETLEEYLEPEEAEKRWKQTFNEVVMVLGKGCHAPYTPVYNALTGMWQRLDSFAAEDNLVVGYTNGELVPEYATESFLEGSGPMFRVTTRLGFSEDVYEGHKYYVWKKKDFYRRNRANVTPDPQWTEVRNLEVGDKVALAMGFDVAEPKNLDIREARALAYLIGDGMCPTDDNPIINVDFGDRESESLANYLEASTFIGDAAPTVTQHKAKKMIFVRHGRNSRMVAFAREHGLWNARAHNKSIPASVWASDNSILREFLGALWSTDGTVYLKKTNSTISPTAEYCTISEQLAHDVQRMLQRLGIPASLRSRIPTYTYKGEKKKGQRAYYVTINGIENFLQFERNVRLFDHKALAVNEGLKLIDAAVYRQNMNAMNLYWDAINSITPLGDGEYWTMTQPNSSNYVGDGFLSHQSGKDYCSTIICAYMIYLILCLKDPQEYFGKPPGDYIDIMNIAINSTQANNVFFKGLKQRLKHCPWFSGRYEEKMNEINFDKNIRLVSGHSKAESLEGYNVLAVILDEISGFDDDGTNSTKQVTADSTYKMHRASVTSRFGRNGKLILLSFPRSRQCFISQRYNQVVAEKEVIERTHTFKMDESLPDGITDNEFTISWNEDHITKYAIPGVFALKRPSFEINPTKTIDDYMIDFMQDPVDAGSRFLCMPPESVNAFFRDKQALEDAFTGTNGIDSEGKFYDSFLPVNDKQYFVHIDLAQKKDRCVVVMSHVDHWSTPTDDAFKALEKKVQPHIVVDVVKYWEPSSTAPVDFNSVRDFVVSLRDRGFNIRLITLDQWRSEDLIDYFNKIGIRSERMSSGDQQYLAMATLFAERRVKIPAIELALNEYLRLRAHPNTGKITHTSKNSDDLAICIAGSVYNSLKNTHRNDNEVIEIETYKTVHKPKVNLEAEDENVIRAPSTRDMKHVDPLWRSYLESIKII